MQFVANPKIVSSSDAGITLEGRHDPSYTSASIKDISVTQSMMFDIPIEVPKNLAEQVYQTWETKMSSSEFAHKLLANVSCVGENVRVRDVGYNPTPTWSK
jgi:hypothetical protein